MSSVSERWPLSVPEGRWCGFGPYYAMFPINFVREMVDGYCPPGGGVLDPFCGRGTVPFVAQVTGRDGVGVDLHPVAYVFSSVKTNPCRKPNLLLARLREIWDASTKQDAEAENAFEEWAWHPRVLRLLKAARRALDWRGSKVDRTLMAILLVHIHAKTGNGLSNQMHQSKAVCPNYAVRWWKRRGLRPPELDPIEYISERVSWRYRYGVVGGKPAEIRLGDARESLRTLRPRECHLMLTSPPYAGVTNYGADNWIREWLLGGQPQPSWDWSQRYGHREAYEEMLRDVFAAARRHLVEKAIVLVRTDARDFTRIASLDAVSRTWPGHRILFRLDRPTATQTQLFGHNGSSPGEADILALPPRYDVPGGWIPWDPSCRPATMPLLRQGERGSRSHRPAQVRSAPGDCAV